MRILPLMTSALVTAALYFAIAERDQLLAFAQVEEPEEAETEVVEATEAPSLIRVVVQHSVAEAIDNAVILRGQTEAARQVTVRAQTAGQVVSDPLRKGAYVNEGDVLCRIDMASREASLAQAEAALSEAELSLSAAEKLNTEGYASETRLRGAEAAVSAARAALDNAERDIRNTEITAPFGGLLETDTAELGTLLSTGGECATIIQLDPIKLVGFLPETEVEQVQIGSRATAELASGLTTEGRVNFIARSADATTRTFRVEIEVPNADLSIRDGQTAEIMIATDGREAHLVPQSALTLNDDGILGLRILTAENVVEFVPVEAVRDTIDGIWVAGLEPEADIIVVGQEYVVEGVTVAPTFREDAL